jgi:hypothetical protein
MPDFGVALCRAGGTVQQGEEEQVKDGDAGSRDRGLPGRGQVVPRRTKAQGLLPEAREDWLAVTYAREYADGALISDKTRATDMRDPVLVWLDTHAPSGLAVYNGDRLPALKGAILSGGLITQDIRVVRPQDGQRVRDVRVGPDGFVYVLTDGERGRVLRLEPAV